MSSSSIPSIPGPGPIHSSQGNLYAHKAPSLWNGKTVKEITASRESVIKTIQELQSGIHQLEQKIKKTHPSYGTDLGGSQLAKRSAKTQKYVGDLTNRLAKMKFEHQLLKIKETSIEIKGAAAKSYLNTGASKMTSVNRVNVSEQFVLDFPRMKLFIDGIEQTDLAIVVRILEDRPDLTILLNQSVASDMIFAIMERGNQEGLKFGEELTIARGAGADNLKIHLEGNEITYEVPFAITHLSDPENPLAQVTGRLVVHDPKNRDTTHVDAHLDVY